MAPPAWAFQLENFEQPPHEELICSICQLVFCEPVECPCNHVFCNKCIKTWIQIHRSCPICRERTPAATLHPVNRIIKNLINGLKLQCKNASLGCDLKVTIESCEAHMKVCSFETEDCPNQCGTSMYRKDIAKHKQEDCLYRECKMCGLRKELGSTEHNCLETMKVALDRLKGENLELKEKVQKLENELDQVKQPNTESFTRDRSNFDWTSRLFPFSPLGDDSASLSGNLDRDDNNDEDDFNALSFLTDTSSSSTPLSLGPSDLDRVVPGQLWNLSILEDPHNIDNNSVLQAADSIPTREPPYHSEASAEADSCSNAANGDAGARRSVKRRIPARGLFSSDSSDDSNNQSSRKLQRSSSDEAEMDVEERREASASSYNHPSRRSKRGVRFRSAVNPVTCGDGTTLLATCSRMPVSTSSHDMRPAQILKKHIFERTLSLLEPYNSDSDPEYVPTSNSTSTSSDSDVVPTIDTSSSSDEEEEEGNEHPSISSESSYDVEVPPSTFDLLQRYTVQISDTDSDWVPSP